MSSAKPIAKGKAVMSSPSTDIVVIKPHKARAVPRSPLSPVATPMRSRARVSRDLPMRRKEVFVEIPVSMSVSKEKVARARRDLRDASADLVELMAEVTIREEVIDATTDPTNAFAALLKSCSSEDVQPFSSFLASPILKSLITTSTACLPIFHKLGEASYSEVFRMSLDTSDPKIVIKVIPLLDGALLQPDDGSIETELPDCSTPEDVLREIDITRKMAGLQGGGFVDFHGSVAPNLDIDKDIQLTDFHCSAFVVKGRYPSSLLVQWDAYRSTVGTESIRPGLSPSALTVLRGVSGLIEIQMHSVTNKTMPSYSSHTGDQTWRLSNLTRPSVGCKLLQYFGR